MAKSKVTTRRRKNAFHEAKGKIVDSVEIKPSEHGYGVGIMFQDRTYLSFDVEVEQLITVTPELSDWKTGNYKPIKRWPTIQS
jgi:hypothetical protein